MHTGAVTISYTRNIMFMLMSSISEFKDYTASCRTEMHLVITHDDNVKYNSKEKVKYISLYILVYIYRRNM